MRLRTPLIAMALLLALVGAACSGDDADSTTTTTEVGGTTVVGGGDGSAAPTDTQSGGDNGGDDGTATTTAAPGVAAIPEFTIVSRDPSGSDDEGDTVVILLDPESYESLTDIDLQNVIAEVVDEAPPVGEAHVVDSEDVTEIVLMPRGELTAEQQRLLDIHYMARLEDAFRIVYVGPFTDTPNTVLGS